jgi:hypothetical protein
MRRTLAMVCVALGALAACSGGSDPATIDDPTFVRRANAVCARDVPGLRAPERRATSTTTVTGAQLDRVADGLQRVAARLRDIPVTAEFADEVDAWLDDWDAFVEVGHRYADAVAADDQERYTEIDDEAVDLAQQIGRFAKTNGIDSCIL